MIKKLRRQFIALGLTSVLSVILIVLLSVNFTVYTSISASADSEISQLREFIAHEPDYTKWYGTMPNYQSGSPDAMGLTRGDVTFFVVRQNSDGTLNGDDLASVPNLTSDRVSQLATQALNNYSVSGGNVELFRYRIYEGEAGEKTIIFLNIANSIAFFHRLLRMSILVALLSFAVAGVSVLFISKNVVNSAARSMDRQKQFITNAGHDLKTPIAVIGANMDVLTMETGENKWINSTKNQLGRLKRLVNDLIDVSKLSEDSIALEFDTFDLTGLVSDTGEVLSGMAELRGLRYSQSIAPGIKLHGSEQYIRRMLTILCDNALKYTDDEGEIRLSLVWYKNAAYFSLYNTCENADEIELDRLFDRFYRGDKSRTGGEGSGIGLAVASAIAEAHGGELTVSREGEKGIVFTAALK